MKRTPSLPRLNPRKAGTLGEMTEAWAGVVVIRVAEADLVVEVAPDVVEKPSNP